MKASDRTLLIVTLVSLAMIAYRLYQHDQRMDRIASQVDSITSQISNAAHFSQVGYR